MLAAIALVLVLRWRDVTEVYTIALVALTPFVLIPLVLADVVAWFSRSPTLRIGAVATTAACLFTVAPFDAVVGCRPSDGTGAITIMTANVLSGGGSAEAIAANVVAADPDVLILQESNRRFLEAFAGQPGLESWVERSDERATDRIAVVVWSKWPMPDITFDAFDAFPGDSSILAVVDAPQGRFTVGGVHTASPTTGHDIDRWHRQFDELAELPTDQPTVIGGDFNATEDHRPFRQLLDQGWTDVHDDKGCGPDLTWPSGGLPFPVMRLDHILVTDDFEVLSTEIGDPGGSDHHPVISRIRLTDG